MEEKKKKFFIKRLSEEKKKNLDLLEKMKDPKNRVLWKSIPQNYLLMTIILLI